MKLWVHLHARQDTNKALNLWTAAGRKANLAKMLHDVAADEPRYNGAVLQQDSIANFSLASNQVLRISACMCRYAALVHIHRASSNRCPLLVAADVHVLRKRIMQPQTQVT